MEASEAGETPDRYYHHEIAQRNHFTVTEMDFKDAWLPFQNLPGHSWYAYVFKVTGFEGRLISDEECVKERLNGYHMMRSYLKLT